MATSNFGRTRKVERRREDHARSRLEVRRSLATRSSGTRIGGTLEWGAESYAAQRTHRKPPSSRRNGQRGRREDTVTSAFDRRIVEIERRWPRGLGEYFASSWSMISMRRRRCQSPAQSRAKQPGLPPRARSSQSRTASRSAPPPFFSLRAPSGGAVVSSRPRRDRRSSTHTARVAFRARRWRP
jgi:hypothetical protein